MNFFCWLFSLLVLLILGSIETVIAGPLTFNGTWDYKNSSGELGESFSHGYGMNFNEEIELTSAMNINGLARYDYRDNAGEVQQILSPSLTYNLNNDLFRYSLYGAVTKTMPEERSGNTVRSWETQLDNGWDDPTLPNIQLSFGQTIDTDDLEQHFADSQSNSGGVSLEWEYKPLLFFYSFSSQEAKDHVAENSNSSSSQLARVDFSDNFWRDRLGISFSHQYNISHSENTVPVGPDNIALLPVQFSSVSAGVDDTPEQTVIMPSVLALIDGNRNDLALTIEQGEVMNIVVRSDFQTVDTVYLYTVEGLTIEAEDFRWDIYISLDGMIWTLYEQDASYSYNSAFRRFEIDARGVEDLFVKIVNDATSLEAIGVSEIEGVRKVTATGPFFTESQDATNQLTDFNTSLQLTRSLQLSYSLSSQAGEVKDGIEQHSFDHATNLKWSPNGWFSMGLNGSESIKDYQDRPLLGNRAYGINLTTQLLPTLDVSMAAGRSETFEEGDPISGGNNYSFYTNAAILPDLNSSFDISYSEGKDELNGTLTTSVNTRLRFTAWLLPGLEADVIGNYSETKTDVSTATVDGSAALSWRISDRISTGVYAKKNWDDFKESTDISCSMNLALTRNNQVSVTYSYQDENEQLQNVGANWSWSITDVFSFRAFGNYQDKDSLKVEEEKEEKEEDGVDWQVGMNLTMRSTLWE